MLAHLSQRTECSYLISQASFLHYIHAYVQNVLHQLFTFARRTSRLLALLFLFLARLKKTFSQDFQISSFNGYSNDLFVIAVLVTALKYSPYGRLEVLLYAPLQDKWSRVGPCNTGITTTRKTGVECGRILAR